jgi:hypothetical protein
VAAALAASNLTLARSWGLSVCFLEITDEPGGQLTASAVPAIDFGSTFDDFPANFAAPFADFLSSFRE